MFAICITCTAHPKQIGVECPALWRRKGPKTLCFGLIYTLFSRSSRSHRQSSVLLTGHTRPSQPAGLHRHQGDIIVDGRLPKASLIQSALRQPVLKSNRHFSLCTFPPSHFVSAFFRCQVYRRPGSSTSPLASGSSLTSFFPSRALFGIASVV